MNTKAIAKKYARIFPVVALLLAAALYALGVFDLRRYDPYEAFAADDLVLTGELSSGRFVGAGQVYFENGDTFDGYLTGGRFEGKGVFTSNDGWVLAGEFVQGLPHGYGVYSSAEGWKYEGTFNEGEFSGNGVFTDDAGQVLGVLENGVIKHGR